MEMPKEYEGHLKEYTEDYIMQIYNQVRENEELVVIVGKGIFDVVTDEEKLIPNPDKDNIFTYKGHEDINVIKTELIRTLNFYTRRKDSKADRYYSYNPFLYNQTQKEKNIDMKPSEGVIINDNSDSL